LYSRLLRLKHVHPNSWQRAVLGEGAIAVGGVLVLADLASLWVLPALPLTVAAVVKGHDVLAGLIAQGQPRQVESIEAVTVEADSAPFDIGEDFEIPEQTIAPEAPHQPDPVVAKVFADVFEESSVVRVIPASPRRAAARPGAAAARAQATASRPRRKADG
jgi:hypothetical protein